MCSHFNPPELDGPLVGSFHLKPGPSPPTVGGYGVGVGWNHGPFGIRILIFYRLLGDRIERRAKMPLLVLERLLRQRVVGGEDQRAAGGFLL